MHACAAGQFINSFNISGATRTTLGTGAQMDMITYVGGICTDGTVLPAAAVNTATNYGWSYVAEPAQTSVLVQSTPALAFSDVVGS